MLNMDHKTNAQSTIVEVPEQISRDEKINSNQSNQPIRDFERMLCIVKRKPDSSCVV